MRNISFSQLIVLVLLGVFLFGDFSKIKKHLKVIKQNYNLFINKKHRKKGT